MYEEEPNVKMKGFVPDIVCHLSNQDATLSFAPSQHFANEAERVWLDAHGHVFALIPADFFHALIFRPGANWDLQPFRQ
jgi:hypothetical protein